MLAISSHCCDICAICDFGQKASSSRRRQFFGVSLGLDVEFIYNIMFLFPNQLHWRIDFSFPSCQTTRSAVRSASLLTSNYPATGLVGGADISFCGDLLGGRVGGSCRWTSVAWFQRSHGLFVKGRKDICKAKPAKGISGNAKSLRLMAKFMSDTDNKCLTRLFAYVLRRAAWSTILCWAHWGWDRIGFNTGRNNPEIGMTCETVLHDKSDKSECRCMLWLCTSVLS